MPAPSRFIKSLFFFNDTATTEIYTLSLHDALPILAAGAQRSLPARCTGIPSLPRLRSEEHTSELQSPVHLVCRLLLEKKTNNKIQALTVKKDNRVAVRSIDETAK